MYKVIARSLGVGLVRLAIDVLPRWMYKPREKCQNLFCFPTIPPIVSIVICIRINSAMDRNLVQTCDLWYLIPLLVEPGSTALGLVSFAMSLDAPPSS